MKRRDNFSEITKILLFILNNSKKPISIKKIDKMIFYIQFNHYHNNKETWLNNDFIYTKNGVSVSKLNVYLKILQEGKIISIHNYGNGLSLLTSKIIPNKLYTKKQLETLNIICKQFESFSVSDICTYCENEEIFKNIKINEVISIKYSKDLKRIYPIL